MIIPVASCTSGVDELFADQHVVLLLHPWHYYFCVCTYGIITNCPYPIREGILMRCWNYNSKWSTLNTPLCDLVWHNTKAVDRSYIKYFADGKFQTIFMRACHLNMIRLSFSFPSALRDSKSSWAGISLYLHQRTDTPSVQVMACFCLVPSHHPN